MKKNRIAFWISTTLIFLFEGVLVALTFQSQMAIDGITSLGYPAYFAALLSVFKIIGSGALIIPQVGKRYKEWAYAGFGIDFISAFVSLFVVYGFGSMLILPVVCMILLVISYKSYHKLNA